MVKDCRDFMLERIIEGPLALTVTPEMSSSVRLSIRLSQTPVSLLRLLMQVKEWRLEVSSDGKRIGEIGQLMNCKVRREERDLRAVMERETSSEQLERRRERRWRKGLEESQVVVLWRGKVGEQGSFEVGMLSDWRALSCFGSSVLLLLRVVGVEGGTGVGVWVGVRAGDGAVFGVGFEGVMGVGAEGGDGDGDGAVFGVGFEGAVFEVGDAAVFGVGFVGVIGVGAEGDLEGEMVVLVVVGGETEEVRMVEQRRQRRRSGGSAAIAGRVQCAEKSEN